MCESKFRGSLGFKDLKTFNVALLAKQEWRILQEKDSMLHKIYKAKYFPKVNFLESTLGNNPSYAFRDILEAKNLLIQGCRWRIGDGKSVKIWKDNWIPGHQALHKELSNMEIEVNEDTVDSLMDGNTKWWNIDKVRALFNPNVAVDIMKIIICPREQEDKWTWTQEKCDNFSVKSAYRFFIDTQKSNPRESANASKQQAFWKVFWKMKITNKFKLFAWRACKEGLPIQDNLIRKHVYVEDKCCFCQDTMEDLSHALFYRFTIQDH